jgi:Aminotransferase class-V
LNYLNTAALGPTPRFVLDATLKAWRELEANPVVMAYADGAVHKETDVAREQLAALIGCSADELLITRSATAAMNAVAFSVDLNPGDRVLTTDVEHEGGSIGWEYLKKYKGVKIDLISIAVTDTDSKSLLERFEKAITSRTRVISVSHVVTIRHLTAASGKPQSNYSYRRATIGSTRDARRAGRYAANSATRIIKEVAAVMVSRSFGARPNRSDEMNWFNASAAARPTTTPTPTTRSASLKTELKI